MSRIRLSVASKLAAGFGSAVLILLAIGITAYRDTKAVVAATAARANARQFLWSLEQIVSNLRGAEDEQRGYILTGDPQRLQAYRDMIAACDPTLDELKKRDPSLRDDVEALKPLIAKRAAELQQGIELRDAQGLDAAAASMSTRSEALEQVRAATKRLAVAEQTVLDQRARDASSTARRTSFTIAFGTLLAIIVMATASVLLSRGITHPVRELVDGAERIGGGDLSFRIAIDNDDEIGELAKAFNRMAESLESQRLAVSQSGTALTGGVKVMTSGSDMLLIRSQEQVQLAAISSDSLKQVRGGIERVFHAADKVAAGTEDSAARAIELQASSEAVRSNMDRLFESVANTSSSTLQMSASAVEMAGMTGELSEAGDELLSFVSEMESTTRELKESSRATAELSRHAREEAAAGRSAVEETVVGIDKSREITENALLVISDLAKRAEDIERIAAVIASVTHRTNLLALNAAIIAAQAGEHGRPFSIVAEEMRDLAEQTRGSTNEIAEIIVGLQNGSRDAVAAINEGVDLVRGTVKLARDASESLNRIVHSSNESFAMSERISAALEQQAVASRRLHETTSRMTDHIAQNRRSIDEQSRGAQVLAREADQVHGIAAQVKSASEDQLIAARGIATAMDQIQGDAREMRDLLERQMAVVDQIATASATMRDIAQQNNALAGEFTQSVRELARAGEHFDEQVSRLSIAK